MFSCGWAWVWPVEHLFSTPALNGDLVPAVLREPLIHRRQRHAIRLAHGSRSLARNLGTPCRVDFEKAFRWPAHWICGHVANLKTWILVKPFDQFFYNLRMVERREGAVRLPHLRLRGFH